MNPRVVDAVHKIALICTRIDMSRKIFVRRLATCKTLVKVDTALLCLHRYHAIQSKGCPSVYLKQMGKNGKKVKSDRINAVRKQYDAFLEEDRKRKDRNEYILERLDKMRSCTAVVPVRHAQTTNVFDNISAPAYGKTHIYPGRIFSYENPKYNANQSHSPSGLTTLDEEALIKELSKKYILIPKHQHAMDFEYKYPAKSSVEDVNDWRSKYSILEELKKCEKEEDNKFAPNKDSVLKATHLADDNINEVNLNDRVDKPDIVIKAKNNMETIPTSHDPSFNNETDMNMQNIQMEKELFDTTNLIKNVPVLDKKSEIEDTQYNSNMEGDHLGDQCTEDLTEKEKIQSKYELECKPELEENCVEEMRNKQYPNGEIGWQEDIELLPKSHVNKRENINELPIQMGINLENDKNDINPHTLDLHDGDYSPKIEQTHNAEIKCENKTIEPEMLNQPNVYQTQSNEHDVQAVTKEEIIDETTIINDQEMQPEISENAISQVEIQKEQYQEHDANSQQEYDNTMIETQIQDFEAEQNNMFYSEQTENYTYDDQADPGDNATVEYANNEGYEQSENYAYYEETPNNQAYSNVYQETPQSQDYSHEINEHEESTEQFDPNYQNQYENYGQGDPQPETVQEYTAEEYDAQQNFDQAVYEESNYNAVEEVQQNLDNEEGYTKPLEAVESNLDVSVPREEIPENPIIEQEVKVTS